MEDVKGLKEKVCHKMGSRFFLGAITHSVVDFLMRKNEWLGK